MIVLTGTMYFSEPNCMAFYSKLQTVTMKKSKGAPKSGGYILWRPSMFYFFIDSDSW